MYIIEWHENELIVKIWNGQLVIFLISNSKSTI